MVAIAKLCGQKDIHVNNPASATSLMHVLTVSIIASTIKFSARTHIHYRFNHQF